MNRPPMLDFHEKLEKVLGAVVREEKLSSEEKKDLTHVARTLFLNRHRYRVVADAFLEKYRENDRCKRALNAFQNGMKRELSIEGE